MPPWGVAWNVKKGVIRPGLLAQDQSQARQPRESRDPPHMRHGMRVGAPVEEHQEIAPRQGAGGRDVGVRDAAAQASLLRAMRPFRCGIESPGGPPLPVAALPDF